MDLLELLVGRRLPLYLLVACRTLGLTLTAPVFANPFVPAAVRVALGLLLGAVVLPAVPVPALPDGPAGLVPLAAMELAVGLTAGFLGQMLFAAVRMAGSLLDLDLGFAMTQVLDPLSGEAEPIIGRFWHTLALLLFLVLDGHHALLSAMALSYRASPPGAVALDAGVAEALVGAFAAVLELTVRLALPVLGALLLAAAAMAALSRAAPQFNLFQVGFAFKTGAGLLLLAVTTPLFLRGMEVLFREGDAALAAILSLWAAPHGR